MPKPTPFGKLATLILALACGFGISILASAQSMTATATAPAAPNPQLALLQKQLVALQKRVAELEKDQAEDVGGSDDSDQAEARTKLIERRLAALERAPSDGPGNRAGDEAGSGGEAATFKAPFIIQDKTGRVIFRVDTVGDRPVMVVGNPQATVAVLGVNPDGNSSLRLFDNKRGIGVDLVAEPEGGNLALLNGNAKEVVTLSVDKAGAGRVKVSSPSGRPLAGLLGEPSGGRVMVANPSNGSTLAALSASPEGGMVTVYATSGGGPRLQLVAEKAGAILSLNNPAGQASVAMETTTTGSGRFIITDGGGDIMVEAGVAPKGFGMVRAGPGGRGPAGVIGGTVQLASSIQGRE